MKKSEVEPLCCCFTGHRPEKLTQATQAIYNALHREIDRAIADGYGIFITGMSRGVDIWAAEIILEKREHNKELKLVCASPFDGFEKGWSADWQERYKTILKKADTVRYICPHYSRSCFQTRNKWMIDHSSRVIAVYTGEKGGTRNTIQYAKGNGVAVRYAALE